MFAPTTPPNIGNITVPSSGLLMIGTTLDLLIVAKSLTQPNNQTSQWNVLNQNGIPGSGQAFFLNSATQINVHHFDDSAVDQSSWLTTVQDGAEFNYQGFTWTVTDVNLAGSHVEFTIAPNQGRPTAGLHDLNFVWGSSDPVPYVRDIDHLLTLNPNVQGFEGTTYDGNPTLNDNAYGIDINVDQLISSPDWDFVAVSNVSAASSPPPSGGDSLWTLAPNALDILRDSQVLIGATGNPETNLEVDGNILVGGGLSEQGIFFESGFISSNKFQSSIFKLSDDRLSINNFDGIEMTVGNAAARAAKFQINQQGIVGIGSNALDFGVGEVQIRRDSPAGEVSHLNLINSSTLDNTSTSIMFSPNVDATALAKIRANRTNISFGGDTDLILSTYQNGLNERAWLKANGNLGVGDGDAQAKVHAHAPTVNVAGANLRVSANDTRNGFYQLENIHLNVTSAIEVVRLTMTGANGLAVIIKIEIMGHTAGIGNGGFNQWVAWDGSSGTRIDGPQNLYWPSNQPQVTYTQPVTNSIGIQVGSSNLTNQFIGMLVVEFYVARDFSGNDGTIG